MTIQEEYIKYRDIAKAAKLLRQAEKDYPKNQLQHTVYKNQLDQALRALEQ